MGVPCPRPSPRVFIELKDSRKIASHPSSILTFYCGSICVLYSIKQQQKDFKYFFAHFEISQKLIAFAYEFFYILLSEHRLTFLGVMRDPTQNFGPIGWLERFDVYWILQTSRQAKYKYIHIREWISPKRCRGVFV